MKPSPQINYIGSEQEAKVSHLVAFTGGGSAGHVTPNLALIDRWTEIGGRTMYVGRANSVEFKLLQNYKHVPFFAIPSERLRRYFHWGNFVMPFIVLVGIVKATWILFRQKPIALFSKGGFVALPVVIAAWINRIPIFIHESDGSLGLANKLSLPFTTVVCLAQERAQKTVNHSHIEVTGSPLRKEFYQAQPQRAVTLFSLSSQKPLLLIFGGSLGAKTINECVWSSLDHLLENYEIIHVVGSGNLHTELPEMKASSSYQQLEYIQDGFADLLACAHLVVCRAGANAVAELIALRKPALLIPLSSLSSRGDQAMNAEEFVKLGGGLTVDNESIHPDVFIKSLNDLEKSYQSHVDQLTKVPYANSTDLILELISAHHS